jgi:S1-C subfamily serine protease
MFLAAGLGCAGPDPEVARLTEELAALRARVEALETRPATGAPPADPADAAAPSADEEVRPPVAIPRAALSHPDLAGQGRLAPHVGPERAPDGLRVSGVRHGTVADRAGLQNGDVVHAVNGWPTTSVASATAALDAARRERPPALRVDLTRRGQRRVLEIPLVDDGDPAAAAILAALRAEASAAAP